MGWLVMRVRVFALVCTLLGWGFALQAQDETPVFEQPEDPQETLRSLDDIVLQKQKALFAARMRGDAAEIKKAQEEFEAVQRQRGKAVRAIEGLR